MPNMVRAALERPADAGLLEGRAGARLHLRRGPGAGACRPCWASQGLNYFNVGSEKGVKVKDVLQVVTDIVGHPLRIDDLGERPGDVPASYATSERLRKQTDWRPQVDLEEGLRRTVAFYEGLQAKQSGGRATR